MSYATTSAAISEYRRQIGELRQKMRAAQASVEPEQVADYEFGSAQGKRRLSALFGDKDDLFVIHNMGTSCPNCTMWADGFNGVYPHLADRAAFVVASPDSPETQQRFAAGRNWRFPMISHQGTSFAADMGYRAENGFLPGVSVFKREGDTVLRVADTGFRPGDDFCAVWHLFDLMPEGPAGWRAKFSYG